MFIQKNIEKNRKFNLTSHMLSSILLIDVDTYIMLVHNRTYILTLRTERRDIMANTKRLVFTFDERSLESLEKIKKQGRFSSLADTVRQSLQISKALQSQGEQGFKEVVVRNPETKEERVLVIPHLISEQE